MAADRHLAAAMEIRRHTGTQRLRRAAVEHHLVGLAHGRPAPGQALNERTELASLRAGRMAPEGDHGGLLTLYSNLSDQGHASSPCGAARACTRGSHPNSLQGGQRRTKAQRAAIVGAYEAGETIRQIADRLGFHRDTVSAALERESVARRYHQRVDVDLGASAAELERQGLTLYQDRHRPRRRADHANQSSPPRVGHPSSRQGRHPSVLLFARWSIDDRRGDQTGGGHGAAEATGYLG